jgi:hypothetical protein
VRARAIASAVPGSISSSTIRSTRGAFWPARSNDTVPCGGTDSRASVSGGSSVAVVDQQHHKGIEVARARETVRGTTAARAASGPGASRRDEHELVCAHLDAAARDPGLGQSS